MATWIRMCAWCSKELGRFEAPGTGGRTDGICDDCLLHNFPHIYENIQKECPQCRIKTYVDQPCDICGSALKAVP